jgi:hypothetical protein
MVIRSIAPCTPRLLLALTINPLFRVDTIISNNQAMQLLDGFGFNIGICSYLKE